MARMPQVFVTTSWDDDDRTGLRVAELLSTYHLRGTFYVPTGHLGGDSLFTPDDLRTLTAAGFEIGGHTVSHAILTEISPSECAREVSDCKTTLEKILGREVTMFCYPKGRFHADVVDAVRQAGYRGARGTQLLSWVNTFPAFAMPITVQAFPHTRANYARNLARLGEFRALLRSSVDLAQFKDWLSLGKSMFDRVLKQGGMWHLTGHPWELEKLQLWQPLQEMLAYVSNRDGVHYVTNGQLLEAVHGCALAGSETLQQKDPQSVAH